MAYFSIFLTLDWYIDVKTVHVPWVIPYPYFAFQKQPVVFHTMISPRFFFPYRYPYFIFKLIPVLGTISAPKINFLPVQLTPFVPVLMFGVRYVYGIRNCNPAYGFKVNPFPLLIEAAYPL